MADALPVILVDPELTDADVEWVSDMAAPAGWRAERGYRDGSGALIPWALMRARASGRRPLYVDTSWITVTEVR